MLDKRAVDLPMASTPSLKISFREAVCLCFLAVFRPERFNAEEDIHNERLRVAPSGNPERRVYILRRALIGSLQLVLASGAVGAALAKILFWALGTANSSTIVNFQIVAALLLLWGTLAVRGWDIQTYNGETLTERVNQWIYRFLYCAGTVALVISLAWPVAK